MLLTSLVPLVLGLAASARVHKLKLQKIPAAVSNPELEGVYLAEKYGASGQTALMGVGGFGRRIQRPSSENGEQLFWTQEELKRGHGVPLSSMYWFTPSYGAVTHCFFE